MLQMQGKGTREIMTKHGSVKRRGVLKSTGKAKAPGGTGVNGAPMVLMKALHHQTSVMVKQHTTELPFLTCIVTIASGLLMCSELSHLDFFSFQKNEEARQT